MRQFLLNTAYFALCSLLFLGDSPHADIIVMIPANGDSVSYDQSKLVLVSFAKEAGQALLVSTQWQKEVSVSIEGKTEKENFPKEFYNLFESKTTLQSMIYTYRYYQGYSKPETLSFAYTDTMSVKTFWQKPEFTQLVKTIQGNDALNVILKMKGWRDSLYTTDYDDPNNDTKSLFKLHVQLIPGVNNLYFSANGMKSNAYELLTNYSSEPATVENRTSHFHNSVLEQSCTSCHEGLPSADSGKTMSADCNVCHKEKSGAKFLHAPVEMKECSSCHAWSPEKNMVLVESGVPETCFGCHDEKKNLIDTAAVQHPVASDCMTCHSSHGTDQPHLLRQDVYNLCTTCHENQKINHPVGRHPLRFATFGDNNEELSCVTCHNPHGSANASLLKASGGTMSICEQCH